jgi:hypothetical protein
LTDPAPRLDFPWWNWAGIPNSVYSVRGLPCLLFASQTVDVTVTGGDTVTRDVALSLAAGAKPVQITAQVNGTPEPGNQVSVTAAATSLNCTTVTSFHWTQSNSVQVELANVDSATVTATLPSLAAYKAEFFRILGFERGEIETDSEGNIVVDEETQEPKRGPSS